MQVDASHLCKWVAKQNASWTQVQNLCWHASLFVQGLKEPIFRWEFFSDSSKEMLKKSQRSKIIFVIWYHFGTLYICVYNPNAVICHNHSKLTNMGWHSEQLAPQCCAIIINYAAPSFRGFCAISTASCSLYYPNTVWPVAVQCKSSCAQCSRSTDWMSPKTLTIWALNISTLILPIYTIKEMHAMDCYGRIDSWTNWPCTCQFLPQYTNSIHSLEIARRSLPAITAGL